MAESIILHFRSTDHKRLISCIAALTEIAPDNSFYFYPQGHNYVLRITEYRDYILEYDYDERMAITKLLGDQPSASLIFELRRSQSSEACDAILKISKLLSEEFEFVIDDTIDRYWLANDVESSPNFLIQYRYS